MSSDCITLSKEFCNFHINFCDIFRYSYDPNWFFLTILKCDFIKNGRTVAGMIFEKGKAAPTRDLILIDTSVFTGTGITKKAFKSGKSTGLNFSGI